MIRDIAIMLFVAGGVRMGTNRLNLLTVVGEIFAGVLIGPTIFNWVTTSSSIEHVSEVGVVLLLLNAGMHIDSKELRRVGTASAMVALLGVVLPLVGGFLAGLAFGESRNTSLFIGAALSATSIGITARVFGDLKQLDSVNARIVLGAAVADDVLGLIILAIASIAIQNGSFDFANLATTIFVVGSFFVGVAIGNSPRKLTVKRSLIPFNFIFIPIFFVGIGLRAEVGNIASTRGFLIVVVLCLVAFLAKFAAGFVVRLPGADKSLIGLGMVPRGEVGLIFANTAVNLNVFGPTIYSAVVLVVLVTTVLSPSLLRIRLKHTEATH